MRVIRASEYRRMPWKNLGGVTSEVFVEPHPRDPARFSFRISIADVTSDGPFSRFDGYVRHIMLLEGAGMTLDAGPNGTMVLTRYDPHTFAGEWDVNGTLTSGPVRDFNVMIDRETARGIIRVRNIDGPTNLSFNGSCIVHVLEGELEDAGMGDSIVAGGDFSITGKAKVAVAYIGAR